MKKLFLYLISDCTGDTLHSVVRASVARFAGIEVEEKTYSLIRSKKQIDEIIEQVSQNPGIVMYTLVDHELRTYLKDSCNKYQIKYIPVLSHIISDISEYLGVPTIEYPSNIHPLDEEYFKRVEAINFAISHDDGQCSYDLNEADIVIVGASRTSKSPTSIYLSYRGYKTANIPFVAGCELPPNLFTLSNTLIVGLVINPEILVEIRRNRLISLEVNTDNNYVDMQQVKAEILESKKIFTKHGWPVIDVTRRSVEEIAATIIHFYQKKNYGK